MVETYPPHLTWINALVSTANSSNVQGVRISLPNGDTGWLIYRRQKLFQFQGSHTL